MVHMTNARAYVSVGELPKQEGWWPVMLIYQQHGDGWQLAHRHADPRAHGVTLHQAAALACGMASSVRS